MEKVSNDFLLSRIIELKHQGFDEIRIPGGSSKDESHYAGIFIYQYEKETKEIYFLGVPYNSSHWKENDSNGHTKRPNETPSETACRETFEETGLHVVEEDLILVLNYGIPDRKDKTKTHTKNFYACDLFTGNLHNFSGANLIDKETAAPLWFPLSIYKEVLYKGHQKALIETINFLKNKTLELYDALSSF
jgi:ADP-ribose pyrophosphatase YjhB (NUDIX family)